MVVVVSMRLIARNSSCFSGARVQDHEQEETDAGMHPHPAFSTAVVHSARRLSTCLDLCASTISHRFCKEKNKKIYIFFASRSIYQRRIITDCRLADGLFVFYFVILNCKKKKKLQSTYLFPAPPALLAISVIGAQQCVSLMPINMV